MSKVAFKLGSLGISDMSISFGRFEDSFMSQRERGLFITMVSIHGNLFEGRQGKGTKAKTMVAPSPRQRRKCIIMAPRITKGTKAKTRAAF